MISRDVPRLWRQSFPFSCGPAALGSVLVSLGWERPGTRVGQEVELWRETTAVACPGAHPLGLALAAHSRGFRVDVTISGPRPWLWSHIHSAHGLPRPKEYMAIERRLTAQCVAAGVAIHWPGPFLPKGSAGLLLVSAREAAGSTPNPHWIGLLPDPKGAWVADPLRTRTFRSERRVAAWWEHSGFDGTRSWIAIRSPRRSTPPLDGPRRIPSRSSKVPR